MTEPEPARGPSLLSLRCRTCKELTKRQRRGEVTRLTLRPGRRPPGCTCRRLWGSGQGPGVEGPPVGEHPQPPSPPAAPPV